jgi:hypothetical protein
MGRETAAGGNRIVIDHEQVAVVLMADVEVVPEREAVVACQPATVVRASALGAGRIWIICNSCEG